MQINTIWIPALAKKWGVNEETARRWVRDDACTNVGVSAWILKGHIDETESLSQAIAHYHSRTPHHGKRYQTRVLDILEDNGLIQAQR
jgi:soluble lytic murein transglycosylase-like protein